MKKLFFTVALWLCAVSVFAQDEEKRYDYTYKTDMLFYQDGDLQGFTFYPNEYQHNNEDKNAVKAGDVSIHFTPSMAYFKGISALNTFNIISFNQIKNGYKLDLLDTKNPTFRGSVEIYINAKHQCEGILFFNKQLGQYAFFLPEKSEFQLEKEAAYFTIKDDYKVSSYADVIGTTIKPYMQVKNQYDNFEYEKIIPKDSIKISFEEHFVNLKIGENERQFEIKNINMKDYAGEEENPQIARIIELTWKMDKKYKISFYLTPNNTIQMFEMGPTLYYFMMRQ